MAWNDRCSRWVCENHSGAGSVVYASGMADNGVGSRRPLRGKRLLVAAVGVATITFASCDCGMGGSSGNLIAPPPCDDAGHISCVDAGHATDAGSGAPDAGGGTDAGP